MRSATPPRPRVTENSSSEDDDEGAEPPALSPAKRRQQQQLRADMAAASATALVAPPPLPTRGRSGPKRSSSDREQEVTPLRATSTGHQFPQQQHGHLDPRETLLLEKEVLELRVHLSYSSDSLAQLAQLRREGMLSDAEFTHAKQHALQQTGAGAGAAAGQQQLLNTQLPSPQPPIVMLGNDSRAATRAAEEARYSTPLRRFEELPPSPQGRSIGGSESASAHTLAVTQDETQQQQENQNKLEAEPPSATKLGALLAQRLGPATAPPDEQEAAAPEECRADVLTWLRSLRLEKHAVQVAAAGFDDMELLSQVSESGDVCTAFFEAVPMAPGNKVKFIQACEKTSAQKSRTASGRSRGVFASDSRGRILKQQVGTEPAEEEGEEGELYPATEPNPNPRPKSGPKLRPPNEPEPQPHPEPEPEPQPEAKSQPEGTQMERVLAAKSSIHTSQALVLVATMVLCAALIVAPTYILGAIVGEMTSAEGIVWVAFYFIWLLVIPAFVWLRIAANGTFAPALKGTGHEMSFMFKTVCVLAAIVMGMCVGEIRNMLQFSDDFDLRFPFGKMHWDVPVIGDVMVQMCYVLHMLGQYGGFEAVIMYRMRGAKLPPINNREWWATSKQLGRGTLAAAAIITLFAITFLFQWLVLMEIRVVDDRDSAMAEYCNNRGCLSNLWLQQVFVFFVIAAMIASTRNGPEPWPRLTRDLPAAWLLTVYSNAFCWMGLNSVMMAYQNFTGSFGVLGVQMAFEVFVLLVFLWARTLAARAFPRDPSGEAKALIWIIFASDTFAEMAFVNVEFGSSVFWVMVLIDFAMIVMRDADLWDELGTYLKKCCGKQRGKWISFFIAMSAGETDLAANQLDDEEKGVKGSKTRRQKFIKVRMVASQAVASEFIVTGCFLVVSSLCYFLNEAGFVAYNQMIPLQTGVSSDCKHSNGTAIQELACICDGDGAVGGIYTGKAGGCTIPEDMVDASGTLISVTDTSDLTQPLCLVPLDCNNDIRIENATTVMQSFDVDWSQPPDHSYRTCDEGDPVSDDCDPGPDQVRSNMLSFITVFTAQILAVLLSKAILTRKMRKMVADNEQARRGLLVLHPKELKRVEAFVARENERQDQADGPEEELTPLRKMQRGVRAIQFAHRLGKSAGQKESLDDVMVEVAEAVAQHWLDVRLHYIAVVMGYLTGAFLALGFVVKASGRA